MGKHTDAFIIFICEFLIFSLPFYLVRENDILTSSGTGLTALNGLRLRAFLQFQPGDTGNFLPEAEALGAARACCRCGSRCSYDRS